MLQKKGGRIDIRIFANVLNYSWVLSTLGFILFSSMLENFHNKVKIKIFKFPPEGIVLSHQKSGQKGLICH